MRTTIDMPDVLYGRLKEKAVERNTTMRDLLIHAVEASLAERGAETFRLRDASVGTRASNRRGGVTVEDINAAIDRLRERGL